jgi:hypothetical protein
VFGDLLSIGRDVMPNRVALGIGGLEAEPGDHICGVFSSEAQAWDVLMKRLGY